ncbi:GMC oxidoreductase [Alsobacter sp. SYSU M60028]|uniref:GMC oxidoreductase n=1 Tax=Alsobacter ponti TaxID=2962936 RepID=A0ABT1LCV8_9HYPH|nr:GMC oxidoreductase [Alsobacter ponti]MCP8938555.1 GMC oxidoreductase [Alsobacter ponti]
MSTSFHEQFDVVIVGSGPTGATYARVIADEWPAARILMVDAGPIISDPPGMHVANIVDDDQRLAAQIASQGPHSHAAYAGMSQEEVLSRKRGGHDTSMLRRPGLFRVGGGGVDGDEFPASHSSHNVGGMGSHWFGACPRPDESERVPFIERPVLDEALATAERMLRVSRTQFGQSHIARPLREKLEGLFNAGRTPDRQVQPMPMAVNVTERGVERSGSNVIMGDLLTVETERFELRPETVCMRILMDGGRAEGVELKSVRTGELRTVRAGTVVVAADSLHTPQLLFASGIRPGALGRYLNEHPQLTILAEFTGVPAGEPMDLVHGGGVLGDRTVVARMTSGVMWVPYNGERFPYHVQISQVEPASLLPEDQEAVGGNAVLSVSFFLTSNIQADNRVEFSETETDWLGRPKMKLRFRFNEADWARVERARGDLARVLAAVGRAVPGHQPRLAPHGTSLHYQGTIRMGEMNDGASVCDRNSRVWGLDNVYVAGNGVIPTMTAGNPTLTSVALALLGARDIARRNAGRSVSPR